jgi:hypothetical protein
VGHGIIQGNKCLFPLDNRKSKHSVSAIISLYGAEISSQ